MVIKKLKIELLVLTSLLLGVFVSYNLDLGLYVYFNEFKQETKGGYLKDFFVNITVLGDSFWYFVFCFLGIVFLIIIEKTKIIKFDGINNYKNLFYYTAINLFFCGLRTQILKHIVGRARPNHTNINNSFGFDFFTLDSNFHSFPSGHT